MQIVLKNPEFRYEEYGKFDLEEMDNSECKAEFRFRKEDIPMVSQKHLHVTRDQ